MQSRKLIAPLAGRLRQNGIGRAAAAAPVAQRSMALAAAASSAPEKDAQKYIQVTVKDGVAIIRLDQPNSKLNTVNRQFTTEFVDVYDSLVRDPAVKAAVLISKKPATFIAGADIEMLQAFSSVEEAVMMSKVGQSMLDRVANGKLPFVAAIHGEALGGGLECALACHYRLATNSPKTKLGVPEVQLGLLPGAGGTQRLAQLLPLPDALDMMLTGKHLNVYKAKKLGLVDHIIQAIGPGLKSAEENTQKYLEECAVKVAKELAAGKLPIKRSKSKRTVAGLTDYATKHVSFIRNYVLGQARSSITNKTKGNYPAPLKILDAVETGLARGMEAGLDREARGFGELTQSKEARSLISMFFAQRACKKAPREFGISDHPIKNICVVGAGLMGAGIASVSVGKFNVTMKDSSPESLAKGQQHIWNVLNRRVKKKDLLPFDRDTIFTAVHADMSYKQFSKADMVIEAVPEQMQIKHDIIKELEAVVPATCIIATNTSALPIADIAKVSKRPENIIGTHYFSPVDRMALLEIIPHAGTSKAVCAAAFETGVRQGKTCIVVRDVPGFYVNRCLGPYTAEAGALLCEGVDVQAVDKAVIGFGFPVGILALGDEAGLDVASHVQLFLAKHLGERMNGSDSHLYHDMVSAGLLGRKSGKGFYVYGGKKKTVNEEVKAILAKYKSSVDSSNISTQDIQMRLVCRLINEAAYGLQDEIVRTPTDGDIGMIFGIGFPAFLGGPFRYMDSLGIQNTVDRMNRYKDLYGTHFAPAPLLVDMAKNGDRFYK